MAASQAMPQGETPLTRRGFLGWAGGAAALAATGWLPRGARGASTGTGGRPPNFIVIFTDDQGYQDLGCFGSPEIKTPCIDRLAAEGMKLTDFYVASPVCTPSRAALMTGCYPKRVGLASGVIFPPHTRGLHPREVTVAEALKARGYATACVGKWHLGHQPPFLPTRQGFDRYYGVPYSNDMMTKAPDGSRGTVLMRDTEIIEHPADQTTLTERYTEEAVGFIRANKDRPFFLYLPHTMPHLPLAVSERFAGKSAGGMYGDVIECIDWSTGRIADTVRELGLAENTWIIYTSDNGPWLGRRKGKNVGYADPLRAGKGTTYEGGMREPCVVWAPGRVPAGAVRSGIVTSMDLAPTLAGLAGGSMPTDRVLDGMDVAPLLTGKTEASPRDGLLYYNTRGQAEAIRHGKWKFRRAAGKNKKEPAEAELYHLEADIGETTNLAEKHPDVAAKLEAAVRAFDADLEKHARPAGDTKTMTFN